MINKINLLIHPTDFANSFRTSYMESVWGKYFNIIYYDEAVDYDSSNTLAVVHCYNTLHWYKKLLDKGIKLIVDNLWEYQIVDCNNVENSLILRSPNWFWYNESIWYMAKGYNNYVPNKTYKKLALMPMSQQKDHRTQLLDSLQFCIDKLIYSYGYQNIFLPGDRPTTDIGNGEWQRNFNPAWYDNTFFSIVAESSVEHLTPFITEKTFKTMAFQHPLLVFGCVKTLEHLHNLGFETFDNIFDESYDLILNADDRLKLIIENVKNFNYQAYDQLTRDKLKHNQNLFYNQSLVEHRLLDEIITPIQEYAAST